MKKKRKFNTGGEFELSPEALAAGLRMGRNERISDADREAAIAETTGPGSKGFKRLSDKEAADLMGREVSMPEAVAIPVPAPRRMTGRALPDVDMVSDQISRNVPRPRLGNQNDYSMNEQEGSGRGTSTRAPSRGSYDQPGPASGAIDAISELISRTPRGRAAAKRALQRKDPLGTMPMKKGGAVKAKRGDGIAQRGKTKGRFV